MLTYLHLYSHSNIERYRGFYLLFTNFVDFAKRFYHEFHIIAYIVLCCVCMYVWYQIQDRSKEQYRTISIHSSRTNDNTSKILYFHTNLYILHGTIHRCRSTASEKTVKLYRIFNFLFPFASGFRVVHTKRIEKHFVRLVRMGCETCGSFSSESI